MSHAYAIGTRLKVLIKELIEDVADESTSDTVARISQLPYIAFRKRRSGSGRESTQMRIGEGITIAPLKPTGGAGTNERDDVGYRFMVSITRGTRSDEIEEEWAIGVWEQAIRQRFQQRRLSGLDLSTACEIGCVVEPGELPDWASLSEGLDATFLVITVFVRESRRNES